jgi:hypothetical protein
VVVLSLRHFRYRKRRRAGAEKTLQWENPKCQVRKDLREVSFRRIRVHNFGSFEDKGSEVFGD